MILENNNDFTDILSELTTLDGLNESEISSGDWETKLCIPHDRLEDIEFFPNFRDDLISLPGNLLIPDETSCNSFDVIKFKPKDLSKAHDELLKVSSREDSKNKKRKIEEDSGMVLWVKSPKKPRNQKTKWTESFKALFDLSLGQQDENQILKCRHCETESTPQWRMGPLGPRTLCNACGVRFKSGRLLPEYRPAASPTFDSEKHSNFHRKIIQKKLVEDNAGGDNTGEVVDSL
ncbi:hypothetical protein CDL12_02207 [Handroanthus impetiginosus]|uniref:GATA-type domain-containing protein n=1 Tax=Handroanthus impetiginosus TaxID=429701 RepID=A0A2G9I5L8_9LAMI|nr:hypothetical protein CDL12_02207 [Handroanthus impetiginosus]